MVVAYRRPTEDVDVVVECIFSHIGYRIDSCVSSRENRVQQQQGGLVRLREKERKTIVDDLFSLSRVCETPDAVAFTRNNNRHHGAK